MGGILKIECNETSTDVEHFDENYDISQKVSLDWQLCFNFWKEKLKSKEEKSEISRCHRQTPLGEGT